MFSNSQKGTGRKKCHLQYYSIFHLKKNQNLAPTRFFLHGFFFCRELATPVASRSPPLPFVIARTPQRSSSSGRTTYRLSRLAFREGASHDDFPWSVWTWMPSPMAAIFTASPPPMLPPHGLFNVGNHGVATTWKSFGTPCGSQLIHLAPPNSIIHMDVIESQIYIGQGGRDSGRPTDVRDGRCACDAWDATMDRG